MKAYQREFIELALAQQALLFGEFTLKSGRISPYFFNMGILSSGKSLAYLGKSYAQALDDSKLNFSMLFGPAYKGITLAASCAIAFYESKQRDIPYAYNRKEAKDHGEGGILVGAPLKGNVVIIDDVITAGTAIHESMALFKNNKEATCTGVIVALDRQECGKEKNTSAITAIESQYDLQVANIICLDDIIHYLKDNTTYQPHLPNIIAYRERYGICNK